MIEVTLEPYEFDMAAHVGLRRQLSAIKQGKRNAHGMDGSGWNEHIEGAIGELAAAKALGIYWDGSVDVGKRPDLAGYQVRTRPLHHFDLIVRPGDAEDEPYLLVTGTMPTYRVHGWIFGRDAKQARWLCSYAGRTPAYFVPQEFLFPPTPSAPVAPSATAVA